MNLNVKIQKCVMESENDILKVPLLSTAYGFQRRLRRS